MNFKPKSDQELARDSLLEKGDYGFTVLEAEDKVSKNGNEMIEMKLEIFTDNGGSRVLFDWLMEKVPYKLKHFCDAVGLSDKYNAGTLKAIDCEGKSGTCAIIIKEDPSGQYQPKNSVRDYLVRSREETPAVSKSTSNRNDLEDDDIPF